MKNSTFSQTFIEAVDKRDIPYLRSYIAEEINDDPNFEKCVCEDCMEYIKSKDIDITVPYKLVPSEEPTPTDQSMWDKILFHKKVEYLRLNFAYDERIGEIKAIGKKAYADEMKAQENKTNPFQQAPQGRRSIMNKPSLYAIIGVISAFALIIAFLVHILRK